MGFSQHIFFVQAMQQCAKSGRVLSISRQRDGGADPMGTRQFFLATHLDRRFSSPPKKVVIVRESGPQNGRNLQVQDL